METSPPAADGSFPRPPRSFVDGDGRRITVEVAGGDGAADELISMYTDFADEDRSQGLPPRTETRTQDWITGLFDDGVNVVARHDGRVVGHGVLVPFDDSAELAIFVHQEYQHAGIGSRLIRALLGEGEATGAEGVWLCVERSNTVAISLYRSVGFEVTKQGLELEMELDLEPEKRASGDPDTDNRETEEADPPS